MSSKKQKKVAHWRRRLHQTINKGGRTVASQIHPKQLGVMKAAIISLNQRVNLSEKNIRSLEALYFRLWLLFLGLFTRVDYISSKSTRREPSEQVDYYKEASETDLNEYKHVFVHNDTDNFFGGALSKHMIKQIKELCRFKGKLYFLYTDPNLHLVNYAKIIYDRQVRGVKTDFKTDVRITREDVEQFGSLKWNVIWCGRNFDGYYQTDYRKLKPEIRCKVEQFKNVEFFKWLFNQRKVELPHLSLRERKFDLSYYGNWRPKREKKISLYLTAGLKKQVLGFDEKKLSLSNTEYMSYVPPDQLAQLVHQSVASVVIGDPAHNNNITTARFYENILFEVCSFIDIEYDPEKRLYKSPFLKDFMYVRNGKELEQKIGTVRNNEELFNRIIKEQKHEIL